MTELESSPPCFRATDAMISSHKDRSIPPIMRNMMRL